MKLPWYHNIKLSFWSSYCNVKAVSRSRHRSASWHSDSEILLKFIQFGFLGKDGFLLAVELQCDFITWMLENTLLTMRCCLFRCLQNMRRVKNCVDQFSFVTFDKFTVWSSHLLFLVSVNTATISSPGPGILAYLQIVLLVESIQNCSSTNQSHILTRLEAISSKLLLWLSLTSRSTSFTCAMRRTASVLP